MAVAGAFPKAFAQDRRPKHETPAFGTWVIGIASILWYVGASLAATTSSSTSLSALSLLIAFYYGLTGVACAIYWRHRLFSSVKAFLLIGLGPVVGAPMLFSLLVRSFLDLAHPSASYTGNIGPRDRRPARRSHCSSSCSGVILMVVQRVTSGGLFFARRGGEGVPDDVALAALGPTRRGGTGA